MPDPYAAEPVALSVTLAERYPQDAEVARVAEYATQVQRDAVNITDEEFFARIVEQRRLAWAITGGRALPSDPERLAQLVLAGSAKDHVVQ